MDKPMMSPRKKRSAILWSLGSLVLLGILLWPMLFGEDAVDFEKDGERLLRRRIERYGELRRADDWETLYEMTDPWQRGRVKLSYYLKMHPEGIMKILSLEVRDLAIDRQNRKARVEYKLTAEIQPDRLPPEFRRNLRLKSKEDLRREQDFEQVWVFRDNQWYYQMEPELVTGYNQGKPIKALKKR